MRFAQRHFGKNRLVVSELFRQFVAFVRPCFWQQGFHGPVGGSFVFRIGKDLDRSATDAVQRLVGADEPIPKAVKVSALNGLDAVAAAVALGHRESTAR